MNNLDHQEKIFLGVIKDSKDIAKSFKGHGEFLDALGVLDRQAEKLNLLKVMAAVANVRVKLQKSGLLEYFPLDTLRHAQCQFDMWHDEFRRGVETNNFEWINKATRRWVDALRAAVGECTQQMNHIRKSEVGRQKFDLFVNSVVQKLMALEVDCGSYGVLASVVNMRVELQKIGLLDYKAGDQLRYVHCQFQAWQEDFGKGLKNGKNSQEWMHAAKSRWEMLKPVVDECWGQKKLGRINPAELAEFSGLALKTFQKLEFECSKSSTPCWESLQAARHCLREAGLIERKVPPVVFNQEYSNSRMSTTARGVMSNTQSPIMTPVITPKGGFSSNPNRFDVIPNFDGRNLGVVQTERDERDFGVKTNYFSFHERQ